MCNIHVHCMCFYFKLSNITLKSAILKGSPCIIIITKCLKFESEMSNEINYYLIFLINFVIFRLSPRCDLSMKPYSCLQKEFTMFTTITCMTVTRPREAY